jgi:hypothetical protein
MNLQKHFENVKELIEAGHGDRQVFTIHGASGDANPIGSLYVTNCISDCGPFDLKPDEEYVCLYVGN